MIQTSQDKVGFLYKIKFKKAYSSPPLLIIGNEQYLGSGPNINIEHWTIIRVQEVTTIDFTIRIQKKDFFNYSPQFPYLVISIE